VYEVEFLPQMKNRNREYYQLERTGIWPYQRLSEVHMDISPVLNRDEAHINDKVSCVLKPWL
jgi:hypothetical protein